MESVSSETVGSTTSSDLDGQNDGTSDRYQKQCLEDLVCDGSSATVKETVAFFMRLKLDGKISKEIVDKICSFVANRILPKENKMPSSLHVMKKMMDVPSWEEYSRHVCTRKLCLNGYTWRPLPKEKWEEHKHDKCPNCDGPRFQSKKGKLLPVDFYIDLKIEDVIKHDFFTDPTFCSMRGKARDTAPGSYLAGEEASRMRGWVDSNIQSGEFDGANNSIYDVLIDWTQPFDSVHHSTGIVGLRCADVDECHKGKDAFTRVVAIIPGPREPESIAPILRRICSKFAEFVEKDGGIQVTEHVQEYENGHQVVKTRTFNHRAFLTGVFADSVARQKISLWNGQNAYVACGWCKFEGAPYQTNKKTTIYYKGYKEGSLQFLR
ncbi:hypothetical protein BSKO_02870 [Bryopsis sp. KO-2023]|nr:hypothetical protein BSKO_02870 [Bryopsis sp. KO-2023]